MSTEDAPRGSTVALTIGLLTASLAALGIGGFILFDDRSGFGADDAATSLATAALVLVVAAVVVSLRAPVARRTLGAAFAVIDASIIALAASDDGFRFIWTTYEGELLQFEIVLGLVALVLLTPAFLRPDSTAPGGSPARLEGARLTAWARGSLYLCALAAGMFVAFLLGAAHFEATQCNEPGGGECDIALLEGMLWAAGALLLGVAVIAVTEIRLMLRQRARRSALS